MIFDTIVVGLGAVGSACARQLAQRGQRVLGLDRHSPPHAWGSSHGETRITRCAVGEGTAYVPLVLRSHEIWRELEQETGMALLEQCGALILGSGAGVVHGKADFVGRTLATAARCGIPHEALDAAGIARRFPQFRLRGDERGCFEPGGGFVRPERCIEAQLMSAAQAGATLHREAQVASIQPDGAGVRVTLTDGTVHHAGEAVLAAGAWTPGLAQAAAPYLSVTRQVLHWFAVADDEAFAPKRCPVFIWVHGDGPEDSFYGFPNQGPGQGVKVATEQYSAVTPDPDRLDREVTPEESARMHREHVATRMPSLQPRALRAVACLYTMTPDGDFLVERAPDNPRLLVVSACSGHGFKHSAGLGDAVADLLCGQPTATDLAAFGMDRFAQGNIAVMV